MSLAHKRITIYDRNPQGLSDVVLTDAQAGTTHHLFSAPSITQSRKQLGDVKRKLGLIGVAVDTKIGTPFIPDAMSGVNVIALPSTTHPTQKFSATKRFQMAERIVDICLTGNNIDGLVLVGRGGTGKSHIVIDRIHHHGLTQVHAEQDLAPNEWVHVKGGIAPTELYKLLYRARHGLIVFDDADTCFEDEIRVNILKAVLETSKIRTVTWLSPKIAQDGYPMSFQFEGKVIFISNRKLDKIPQPILTRSMLLNLDLTNAELIERVRTIADNLLPQLTAHQRTELLDFMDEHRDLFKDLSLRSFIKAAGIIASEEPEWRDLILFSV